MDLWENAEKEECAKSTFLRVIFPFLLREWRMDLWETAEKKECAKRTFLRVISPFLLREWRMDLWETAEKEECAKSSVADPGSGIGAFLTPGSGIQNRFFPDPGSRIPDLGSRIPDPKPILLRA